MSEPIIDDKSATAAITFFIGLGMVAVIAGVSGLLYYFQSLVP